MAGNRAMHRPGAPNHPRRRFAGRRKTPPKQGTAGTTASLLGKHRFSRPGTAPGTLVAPVEKPGQSALVRVFSYGPEAWEESRPTTAGQLEALVDREGVVWIDVVGLHDVDTVSRLGELFGLHPLALEDVLNVGQRPKVDSFVDHLFAVLKLPAPGESLRIEQLSLFCAERFVITFQEDEWDVFDGVRERIRHGRGRIRKAGGDYLAYALIDAVVDHYFPLLEAFGERLEALEEELIDCPTQQTLAKIHQARRELLLLRRAAWPQRELVSRMERDESGVVTPQTRVFLRDCYDHAVQILDIVESYRELAAGMLDVYLSSLSNRMNEVMKVLTMIATIFMPLSFIAGVYGMNFEPSAGPLNMPELGWPFGYPLTLGVMALVALAMAVYFRRKRWL